MPAVEQFILPDRMARGKVVIPPERARSSKPAPQAEQAEPLRDIAPSKHSLSADTLAAEHRAAHLKAWKAKPWSVRVVSRCGWRLVWAIKWSAYGTSWVVNKYPLLRLLILAHTLGSVGGKVRARRQLCCNVCQYAYTFKDYQYCRGDNGGRGCGCGHWKASRITHKIKLSMFACPVGHFDYGLLGRLAMRLLTKGA